ncbi:MAG: phosphatase PAP2 family protein, partial [Myxococcota bacterium]
QWGFDRPVADWVGHPSGSPLAVPLLETASAITSPGAVAAAAIGVLAVLIAVRRRVEALALGIAVGGAAGWTALAKDTLGRVRPDGAIAYPELGWAFPSGHTSGTAALAVFLAWLATRRRPPGARTRAFALAAGVIAATASVRVLLAVHWLSDVIGGAALGAGWSAAVVVGTRWLLARQAPGPATVGPGPEPHPPGADDPSTRAGTPPAIRDPPPAIRSDPA